ncbi:MAG TPA: phosphoribosylamine--glycine ligase, partial [Bryobacteraceae bacterium]|nr:phosphoribosylamine--glycine ligase [Bryobacteraceae bacterium]
MKVLVIGSGGREHALAWRLAQSPSVSAVIASPGNPGASRVATCVPASDPQQWLRVAREYAVDYTVVGPEAPLVAGVVDLFRAERMPIVGPTAAAARIEGSKSYAKDLMLRAGIPTARHRTVESAVEGMKALHEFGAPVVLKADGLAAGKGVIVAQTRQEAEQALPVLLSGSRVVIEEFLEGEEVSFIVLSDGRQFVPFAPTQDHKAIFDRDQGPNTGGMGAYRDGRILTEDQHNEVARTVIDPALRQMMSEETPFTGFLYAGLMITPRG